MFSTEQVKERMGTKWGRVRVCFQTSHSLSNLNKQASKQTNKGGFEDLLTQVEWWGRWDVVEEGLTKWKGLKCRQYRSGTVDQVKCLWIKDVYENLFPLS